MADKDEKKEENTERSLGGRWLDGMRGFVDDIRNDIGEKAKEKILHPNRKKEDSHG